MSIRLRQTYTDQNAAETTCSEHGCHEMFRLELGGVEIPLCQSCVNQLARQCVPLMDSNDREFCEYAPPQRTDAKKSHYRIVRKDD